MWKQRMPNGRGKEAQEGTAAAGQAGSADTSAPPCIRIRSHAGWLIAPYRTEKATKTQGIKENEMQ